MRGKLAVLAFALVSAVGSPVMASNPCYEECMVNCARLGFNGFVCEGICFDTICVVTGGPVSGT